MSLGPSELFNAPGKVLKRNVLTRKVLTRKDLTRKVLTRKDLTRTIQKKSKKFF